MSLYADYILERTSDQIIEWPEGWATYRYLNDGKSVYIIDIFVVPAFRKQGFASKLADAITVEALEKGCNEMLGSINPLAKGSTDGMKVLLAYGFELYSSGENAIILRKDI